MSEHKATIKWTHTQGDFLKGSYSREHTWTFDGGVTVPASPAPTSVKPPYSNAANVDPEEAYVAAISSCHMLTFLWVASRQGLEVTSYEDDAVGNNDEKRARHPLGQLRRPSSARRIFRAASDVGSRGRASPPGARGVLHRQFGEDADHGGPPASLNPNDPWSWGRLQGAIGDRGCLTAASARLPCRSREPTRQPPGPERAPRPCPWRCTVP